MKANFLHRRARRYTLGVFAAIVSAVTAVACSSGSAPSAPTAPTPTRVIRLSGNLNFGNVTVGTERSDGVLVIANDGNAVLTVTSLTGPGGGAYAASWTSGTIAPSASQTVAVHFTPPAAQSYSGTLTVNADQTSGTNTFAVTGVGVAASGTAPAPAPPTTSSCTFALTPSSVTLGSSGSFAKGTIQVTTTNGCAWAAVAADSWLTLRPSSGTGGGSIEIEATSSSSTTRSTRVAVGGATTTVTQTAQSAPAPAPGPSIPASCTDGPYTWDDNPSVLRCRNRLGQFAPSACCGR